MGEDGVGEGGGGGVAEVLVDDGFDVVGGEDLEGGGEGGLGEGVGVLREEEGAGGVLGGAVLDDGLGDGGDVVVVEAGGEGAAAMAGGAEGDALGGDGGVGVEGVVGGDEAGDVDEVFGEGWLAGLVWCRGWGHAGHALMSSWVTDVRSVPLYGMRVAGGNAGAGSRMIRKWQGKMLVFSVRLA